MSDLGDVIDHLWLHSTFEEDPWCVERAFAAIEHDGEVAIDALIWALGQKDPFGSDNGDGDCRLGGPFSSALTENGDLMSLFSNDQGFAKSVL